MKITKKFIAIIMISVLSAGMAILAIGCYPLMPAGDTEEAGTAVTGGAEDGISGMLAQYGTWIWLIILGVAFYFLLIRPQRQKTKKAQDLLSSIQRGDEVVTIGGLYGRVKDIRDDVMTITIASGVDIKVSKGAVSKKISGTT